MKELDIDKLESLCMICGDEPVIGPAKEIAAAQVNEPQAPTNSSEGPSYG